MYQKDSMVQDRENAYLFIGLLSLQEERSIVWRDFNFEW